MSRTDQLRQQHTKVITALQGLGKLGITVLQVRLDTTQPLMIVKPCNTHKLKARETGCGVGKYGDKYVQRDASYQGCVVQWRDYK